MYHQYGRTLNAVEDITLRQKYRKWMTEGIWIYGKTGVGKSHLRIDSPDAGVRAGAMRRKEGAPRGRRPRLDRVARAHAGGRSRVPRHGHRDVPWRASLRVAVVLLALPGSGRRRCAAHSAQAARAQAGLESESERAEAGSEEGSREGSAQSEGAETESPLVVR